jgi:hypothetical protein
MMTEENFFDMFNRIHNPEYYAETKKKKTPKKKTNRKRYTAKRYPVFKVQNRVD